MMYRLLSCVTIAFYDAQGIYSDEVTNNFFKSYFYFKYMLYLTMSEKADSIYSFCTSFNCRIKLKTLFNIIIPKYCLYVNAN